MTIFFHSRVVERERERGTLCVIDSFVSGFWVDECNNQSKVDIDNILGFQGHGVEISFCWMQIPPRNQVHLQRFLTLNVSTKNILLPLLLKL